jgi:hypothetical protein
LVAVLPEYQVAWLDWDTPSEEWKQGVVEAGQVYSLTVSVRNTGWQTWPHGGSSDVRLGYHWLDSSGQTVVQSPGDDLRTPLTQDVAYGQVFEFPSARVVTPRAPGAYTLVWDMVHEGVAWFREVNAESPLLTMSLTVTGTPSGDYGVIRNGGFEEESGWTLFETAYPARYTRQVRWRGERALQTGIEGATTSRRTRNVFSYSSTEQVFRVPVLGETTLRYWQRAEINDTDFGYVYLRPEGGMWRLLQIVRRDVPAWSEVAHDLRSYAGQQVTLRFGTFNSGLGEVSAMYVDEVSLGIGSSGLCTEILEEGFETDGDWLILPTPHKARYTSAIARTGQRSMQLGIADPAANVFSYSSATLRLAVPEGLNATLSLWYNMPQGGGRGDYGYVLIRPEGRSWSILRTVQDATGGWVQLQEDLSHLSGQRFTLLLGMRNDGGADHAAMYVDDVSLEFCNP